MVHGESEIDLHSSDISRFHDASEDALPHPGAHGRGVHKTYGIVHPAEQWASRPQPAAVAMLRARAGARRRVLRGGRVGAPAVVRGERAARRAVRRRSAREAEWDARWWSPIINAEHLAMRERAGIFDLSAFAIFDVSGPGALDVAAARRAARRWTSPSGASSTRPCSAPGGGFKSDLTIMRLGDEQFRVVTGGAHGMADRKCSSTTCPPTARRSSSTSRRPGRRSGSGARARATSSRA